MATRGGGGGAPRAGRPGAAAVELALVLPLLMALLGGTLEVARLLEARALLASAAREGGRQAATGRLDEAGVRQVVIDSLRNAGVPTAHAVVTVSNRTGAARGVGAAEQLDELRVDVTVPYADLRLTSLRVVTNAKTTVRAGVSWYSLRDRPYPDFPEPPAE